MNPADTQPNPGPPMPIDRKFCFSAYNATTGSRHDENDGLLLLAKDKAVPDTLRFYRKRCEELGSNREHLEAIDLLIGRVERFQKTNPVIAKVPDTTPDEAVRTVRGVI